MRFFVDFFETDLNNHQHDRFGNQSAAAVVGADLEPGQSVVFSKGFACSQLLRNTLSVSRLLSLPFSPTVSFVTG
jgi:hypothetical protein